MRRRSSLFAHGEPMVWLTGGALAICLALIAGLLVLVFVQGAATFWPGGILRVSRKDGQVLMGEVAREESFRSEQGVADRRILLRTGNYELSGSHFTWVSASDLAGRDRPPWALVLERLAWGRFYGTPKAFLAGGEVVAREPEEIWRLFARHHAAARERGRGRAPAAADGGGGEERYALLLATAGGGEKRIGLSGIVRAYPANRLSFSGKLAVYASRWWEFFSAEPREANSEGGVYPAIIGTIVMTLSMSLLVVPFGVLAALYLREYSRQGLLVSAVRIAVHNLAGVPSIVFGVFGLGFFCYILGGSIDQVFFSSRLPNPTYGKGGLLWASLTLALLTLPVVIVATEEALAAVPASMREGSFACGAGKWQTIRRIVLPRAMPGIMTGLILAIARGAGEVAPLMLVGAVKMAPALPVDGALPFVHLERSFMHLGFHIYDLGFQSQNSEAARPMVFTTTLLLIAIVVTLNLVAILVRARLRRGRA